MTVTENNTVNFQDRYNGLTASEVFEGLSVGTYLMNTNGYTTYVYVGDHYVGAVGRYCPRVVELRYYAFTVHSTAVDMQWENMGYNVMTEFNENGVEMPRIATAEFVRALEHVASKSTEALRVSTENAELSNKVWNMQQDWLGLNGKLNQYADDNGMCPDYERRLDTWNEDFSELKLEGRSRDWQVGIKVPALTDEVIYLTIEATSPGKANSIVENMSLAELLEKAYKSGGLEYTTFTADHVISLRAE